MKKYFKATDVIVFLIGFLCLVWIGYYQLYWKEINPLFDNAYKWAEITYTVFTSVVAAGLFYLFTIFTPRFYQIKRFKNNLIKYLKRIDDISKFTIEAIKISNEVNKNYSVFNFKTLLKNNSENVKFDFNACYDRENMSNAFEETILYQKEI